MQSHGNRLLQLFWLYNFKHCSSREEHLKLIYLLPLLNVHILCYLHNTLLYIHNFVPVEIAHIGHGVVQVQGSSHKNILLLKPQGELAIKSLFTVFQ